MRAVAFVLAVAACSGAPKHPVAEGDDDGNEPTRPLDPAALREPEVSAVRPALDLAQVLPDPTERGRWPLAMGTHPTLEPHYDVASALAMPGIGWIELCGRGLQHRHLPGNQDPVDYLIAWCSAQQHDAGDAVYRLAKLRNSVVPGIRDALWLDIANILADNGDANTTAKLIDRNHLEHEVALLDILAATYVEVGKRDDAVELNRLAIEADHQATHDNQCNRYARAIVVGDVDVKQKTLGELRVAVRASLSTCERVEHELRCWMANADCADYFADHGVSQNYTDVAWAYSAWPVVGTSFLWWRIGVSSSHAVGIPGAEEMALVALDASLRTSSCEPSRLGDLRHVLGDLRHDVGREPALDARLDDLLARVDHLLHASPTACRGELAAFH